MKAIIIGAGVSGLTTAAGLLGTGHEVEVFERGPELRAGGNGVLLWPNGTSILRDLGIGVDDLGVRMDSADIMSYDEKPLMRVDLADIAGKLGSHVAGVMRGEIVRRLAAALPDGVLRTGMRCVAIETARTSADAPVTAVFEDGTRVAGDVLIGADGYRSVVRGHLFGPDDIAEYTGLATWHGTTQKQIGGLDQHFVPAYYGRKVAFTTHSVTEDLKHWAFEVHWPIPGLDATGVVGDQTTTGPRSGPSRMDLLREWFAGWPPAVADLIDVLTEEDIKVHPHVIHKVRKWWGEGPITLVGDAAHAVPPRVGWGVNQALEDGWVLSRALEGAADPTPRLRLYEQTRRARARRVRSRGAMLKHVNRMILLLRAKKGGIEATRAVQGNIMNCSNYLHGEVPAPLRA
ncbi:NAD(P)/FAD-dependent oxidoreductase [Lentzea sp.]|uniref:FAD-dependent oxidoreductase n=1 Tax=Lentzea sp. TaxID=56099 RepID=UPI002C8FB8B4|nr:NAD(P)/FAD-dependent oxidoreductase [Lentzea sp.]HUQ54787.1 NAD(P)/FAD-dependent oxidoreductase [Lentzea sp.]